MPQVAVTTQSSGGGGGGGGVPGGGGERGGGGVVTSVGARKGPGVSVCTSVSLATNTESLTTPVLSLATPNVFSSLPPIFSSLLGDFPFNQTPINSAAGTGTGGGGASGVAGGGGDSSSAALVAFPVSIQPSATGTSGSNAGNLILQAQNMGQPFLLTPSYDSRQNPLFNSQSYATPPPSSLATATTGLSPNVSGNLEQLKQQYERTQQLIQQQLFYAQMQMLHHQQSKEGGSGEGGTTMATGGRGPLVTTMQPPSIRGGLDPEHSEHRLGLSSSSASGIVRSLPQFINGSDVMMSSHAVRKPRPTAVVEEEEEESVEEESEPPVVKKSRLASSPGTTTQ